MNPVDLLEGLVSIYSPSQEENHAVTYLVERMKEAGFDSFVDAAGNAVGYMGDGPTDIVLLGHIDTVRGFIDARLEDNQLYGRGTVDAKGCLATFVSACARVGKRTGVRFIVIGAVEEESATSKGARYVITQYRPSYCIIGEPSGWDRVTLGYKGRVNVDYVYARSMSHGASGERPATEHAVTFWSHVAHYAAEYNRSQDRVVDQLDPLLRGINSSDDGFTDRVEMRINIRVPLGLSIQGVEDQVSGFADGATLSFSSEEPPFRADKNTPLVRAFLTAIREQGAKPAFTLKTGTADMNIAGPAWGCPIVAYGPGDSKQDHTPNEHLDLDEYERAIKVLAGVLTRIAS